jgi:hypothetical protein
MNGLTLKSLIGVALPLSFAAACGSEGIADDGGIQPTTASGTGGTTSATGSGGTSATVTGAGGTPAAASTTTAGGTGGTSTAATAGGASSAGGATSGIGGSSGAGAMGGTDASGGTGGTDASGGTGGGGPGGPTITDIVGVNSSGTRNQPNGLDGFLFEAPCSDAGTNYDCANSECSGNERTDEIDFPIGGDSGTTYAIELRVRGVVEARNYTGCSRDAGDAMDSSEQGGDFWCSGGSPGAVSDYNEYTLTIMSGQVDGQPTFFALNARNGSSHLHESWALNYVKTVQVQGGGSIRFRQYDSNCRQIKNCGPGDGGASNCTPVARVLDISQNDPQPSASFMQPYLGGAPSGGYGQFILIDVLGVAVVE